MTDAVTGAMAAPQFVEWMLGQAPERRVELVDGVTVEVPLDPTAELARADAVMALRTAARLAKSRCTVFPAGAPVVIDDRTVFSPPVVVGDGGAMGDALVRVDRPCVVVEVLSAEASAGDAARRISCYAETHGVDHVLVLDPARRTVTHYERDGDAAFRMTVRRGGALILDPPGLTVQTADLFITG